MSSWDRFLPPNKFMLDLQKRLWIFIILWIFKRLLTSNISKNALRNDGLDEAERKSVQKAREFSGNQWSQQWHDTPGEWEFCRMRALPNVFVSLKCKPGIEPYSDSWSNPDMYAPQTCSTLGRGWCGESVTDELKDLLTHLQKASVGKFCPATQGRS